MDITLTVRKRQVYTEVAKTSSYTGAKLTDDELAYDRIFTTDADYQMLERFWIEACNGATERLKPFLLSVSSNIIDPTASNTTSDYIANLRVSQSFDTALLSSTETSLYDYFVNFILSRWYKFTMKSEVDSYAADAMAALEDVLRKIYHKKKPVRIPV